MVLGTTVPTVSTVGLRGQEGMVVEGITQVGLKHPHAASQVMPERTGMWGRSEDLQKWLWEERRMLRVANMGRRRQTYCVCVWGGVKPCGPIHRLNSWP